MHPESLNFKIDFICNSLDRCWRKWNSDHEDDCRLANEFPEDSYRGLNQERYARQYVEHDAH